MSPEDLASAALDWERTAFITYGAIRTMDLARVTCLTAEGLKLGQATYDDQQRGDVAGLVDASGKRLLVSRGSPMWGGAAVHTIELPKTMKPGQHALILHVDTGPLAGTVEGRPGLQIK